MSGTSTVLPGVDVAFVASTNSKAVNSKMGTRSAGMRSGDSIAASDGKTIAKQGKEPMEANLGTRIHAVKHGTANEAKSGGGTKDATGVDFNDVLNKKINHKAEHAAPMETDDVVETETMSAEEFAINPFVHATAASEQVDAAGGGMQDNPENGLLQASGDQTSVQVQVSAEGLDLTGKTAESGEKIVFEPAQGETSEKTLGGVVSESAVEKQDIPVVNPGSGDVVELPIEGKKATIEAQSNQGVASEQGGVSAEKNNVMVKEESTLEPAGKEISASAVADRAGKEVVAPVIGENTGKEIKGLVEDNKSLESVEQAKAPAVQPTDAFKQSMQNQGQGTEQSDSSDAGNRGFGLETAGIQVEKSVDGETSTFEMPDIDVAKPDHEMVGQSFNSVESVVETSSVSTIQASAKVSGDALVPGAMKPIDQIIQQLNVVDSTVSNQRIQMTLTPDDLGTVRISFRQMEGEIVGMVEVQKDQTRRDVEEAMPQLISAMQENGLQVRKIEVLQWNNPDQQASKDESSQGFSLAQEREFAQQNSQGSSDSSTFGQGGGGVQGSRRGPIRLEDIAHSERGSALKGLDFLV